MIKEKENKVLKHQDGKYASAFAFLGVFLCVVIFAFTFRLEHNETDVLPYALSTFSDSWLPTDWYLNLTISYRLLFGYLIGPVIAALGFYKAMIVGRLLSYLLFSFVLTKLFFTDQKGIFRYSSFGTLSILIFLFLYSTNNFAGEWIIGGLESKVFAYIFLLWSFLYLLNKRINQSLLFAGLSLSFHVLIGGFNLLALLACLWLINREKAVANKKMLLQGLFLFLLSGSFGIYTIVEYMLSSFSELPSEGWNTYVNIRVAKHCIPSNFSFLFWAQLLLFTGINLFLFKRGKHEHNKVTSIYTFSITAYTLIGLSIYLMDNDSSLLRYYFFRFADVLLPLLTLLNLSFHLKKINLPHYLRTTFLIVSSILIVIGLYNFRLNSIWNFDAFVTQHDQDPEMSEWIRNNTSNTDVFITPPSNEFFYINCERPIFVSWKHAPQTSADILEWKHRLLLLNASSEFTNLQEVSKGFYQLTTIDIVLIKDEYPNVSAILTSHSHDLDFHILHQTEKQTLYAIP